MLLLMGLLHGANVVLLPYMGRLLSLNSKLDDSLAPGTPPPGGASGAGAGQWVLRIEAVQPGAATAPLPPPAAGPER
jgi:hypothetical protein